MLNRNADGLVNGTLLNTVDLSQQCIFHCLKIANEIYFGQYFDTEIKKLQYLVLKLV